MKVKHNLLLLTIFFVLFISCTRQEIVWSPGVAFPKENIKIGVIHPNEIFSDSLFDQAHYEGTLEMQRIIGLGDNQIIRKTNIFSGDPIASEGAIRDSIAEGANLIIAMSWGYMNVCERLAAEFPGVVFAHATGTRHNDRNFANYSIRLYQARYLSGIVAGLKTQTNRIGFVAAMDIRNSEVTSSVNAFAMGVASVNPDARVYVQVTHSWYDPMGETNAANALIAAGCDVITSHANTPAAQMAAQRAGVWAIGYNADMSAVAPEAIISSVVLNWGVLYTSFVQNIVNGTFIPQTHFYGLAEGAIDITPLARGLAPEGAKEAVLAARNRMLYEGFNIFDGVIETNDGRFIGEIGGTLSDEIILSGINWYYRTVIEL
ncbi:MAG: BMP family ABC transporter substrate-binding protein [Treponema sp.]|nr:BMP family ABC transporter substrate-binding protein [Treponema sp.]